MRYVIVGGGIAGTTAAEELRKREPSAKIIILSEEHHPLYSRVLLPHYIKGKIPRKRVFLKQEKWYAQQGIEWHAGVIAAHLEPRNKFVGASDGREYPYDKLLIATGGEVRAINEDLRGVSYCRTLDDADHFLQLINEQGDRARAIVYGGGFIACEYLNFFAHFQIPTVLIHRGPHFWSRSLMPEAGAFITRFVEDHGVEVCPNMIIDSLEGEQELEGCVTRTGHYAATVLGIGIGIEPDLSWLKDAGVDTDTGVKANEFLEANIPNIYTAGDIAQFYDVMVGRQLQIGNWTNAICQGRAVAASIIGERTRFELVSSYATNLLGLEVIFIGDVEKEVAEEVHVVGSSANGGMTQIFERNGRVVGAVLLGRNQDRMLTTRAIQDKLSMRSLSIR